MTAEKKAINPLETEKITTLLRKFALPSVVAMLVSALYNIVDQIFIGNFVSPVGNAATGVAFPLTTICIAISVLAGVGGASRFSIELGKGDRDEAGKCIGNALFLATILGIVYSVLAFVFCEELLKLFGGSGETLDLAYEYSRVVIIGMPFLILTNVTSNFIRADGSPDFSMMCMVVGAVINIGLDALFVCDWGFSWGMEGAAGATVISQIVSFIIAIWYYRKFKTIEINNSFFRIDVKRMIMIASLGMSNCINQVAICVVQIVLNGQLDKYAQLELAQDDTYIPIAVFAVVMKVNSILISVFIGMAQGMQPIAGYNYGSRRLDRSKTVCILASAICAAVALVGTLCFQLIPEYIIAIFGSGNELYIEFAVKTMRIYLSMITFGGIQMTIANYFSAIGKPTKGVILSLTRQILIIVPLLFILPRYLGLHGILYAAPITDFATFLLALVLILREFSDKEYKKV